MMMSPFKPHRLLALLVLLAWSVGARPDDVDRVTGLPANPLQPIDTSSPRTSFAGFVDAVDRAYRSGFGRVQEYLASPRLFPSAEEMAAIHSSRDLLIAAERVLDLSELPPAMVRESARRLTIQLKEILDRLERPPLDSIPDDTRMAGAEFKRWTVPGSDIRITRVEGGARAGEYLFNAETVARIPEDFERIRHLPYRPGASAGLYAFTAYSPAGLAMALHSILPPRWLLDLPSWAVTPVLDQPLWRWVGIAIVLGIAAKLTGLCYRLSQRWRRAGRFTGRWAELLRPLGLVFIAPFANLVLDQLLRVSGIVGKALTLSLWTVFFLALTWLVWGIGTAVAESVIAHERLRATSIDSQLIRLGLRLTTIVIAVGILIAGADRVGLPAYSVVAGLGVGGLAVALAGQQTLANLLGSLIIMLEKPFSIGQWIKVDGLEGTVEDVGFRSTRIRTFYDSLVTIPSSQLVNTTIDNFDRRRRREVKTVLGLTYDTPPDKVDAFVSRVREFLETQPDVHEGSVQVAFTEFGAHSLDVLVKFLLRAPNRPSELAERQRLFLEILRLAENLDVRFAFPTRTLHVESMPDTAPANPAPS
ncbi:MAG: mechanosensitive ion channel family protein [Methylotetracoccus sp.]